MGVKKTIVRNVFSNWVGLGVNMVAGFFFMPWLISRLDSEVYGLWILIGSLTGYFSLMDIGVRGSVGRYIAHYHARNDQKGVNATLSTALIILSALAVLVLVATAVLLTVFFRIFTVSPDQVSAVRWAIIIVGVNLAVAFSLHVFDGVLWACQRFDILNGVDIVTTLLRVAATLLLVKPTNGLVVLALITLGSTVLADGLKIFFSFRQDPRLRFAPRFFSRVSVIELYGYGVWNFILSICGQITGYTSPAVIAGFLGASLVTPFVVALRLIQYASSLLGLSTGVMTPMATRMNAQEDRAAEYTLLVRSTRFAALYAVAVFGFFLVMGRDFIRLWMHGKFPDSYPLLIVLGVGYCGGMVFSASGSILLGRARHKVIAVLAVVEAIVNLALSIALVIPFGLMGVAVGFTLPRIVISLLIYPVFLCRILDIRIRDYIRDAVVSPFLWGFGLSVIFYGGVRFISLQSLPIFAATSLIMGLGYAVLTFLICLNASERRTVFRTIGLTAGESDDE
jgi:O-antigen/teichoic acid export membrane protein